MKRTTYNKDLTLTVFDVSNSAIIGVLTVLARALPAAATARNIQEAIVKGIEHWKPLLEHFVFNKNTNERVIAAETGYLKKAKVGRQQLFYLLLLFIYLSFLIMNLGVSFYGGWKAVRTIPSGRLEGVIR